MVPTVRQILRAKLLAGNVGGIQKLVIQLRQRLFLWGVHAGNIQSMIVLQTSAEILAPADAVFYHPAEALEHAPGQDQIHIVCTVPIAPDVLDHVDFQLLKKRSEIHLMDNTLDIGQTDLEGMVQMLCGVLRF